MTHKSQEGDTVISKEKTTDLINKQAMNVLPSKTQGVRRKIIRYALTWLFLAEVRLIINHFAPGSFSFADVTYLLLLDIVIEEFAKWLIPRIR